MKGLYDQYNLHHPREIAGSSLRSVSKIPHCCLQIESDASVPTLEWTVTSPPAFHTFEEIPAIKSPAQLTK